jgi:hypothetical protein
MGDGLDVSAIMGHLKGRHAKRPTGRDSTGNGCVMIATYWARRQPVAPCSIFGQKPERSR